jgi:Uma2 family endonuclease
VSVEVEVEQLHRLSTDEYHRSVEAGVFDEDARVELIDGLLARMSPKTRAHENAVAWLARWLMLAVDPERHEVRVASPLTLEGSEPEPDVAVIAHAAPRPYHPATAALVIEVSASSLQRDLQHKPALYARAQVDEYWVVDLEGRRVVVHRAPHHDGYGESVEAHADSRLTAASVVGPPALVVEELLRAAAA